jgi:hypothetical protein
VTLSGATPSFWGSAWVVPPSEVGPGSQLSVWMLAPKAGLNAAIALQNVNGAWSNGTPVAILANGAWQRVSFTVPTSATAPLRWVGVWFTAQSGQVWSGTILIDTFQIDAAVVAPPPSSPYAPPFPRVATIYSKTDQNSASGKLAIARFNLYVTGFDWWDDKNYSPGVPAGMSFGQYLKQLNPKLIALVYIHSSIFVDGSWTWRPGTSGYVVNGTTYYIDPRWLLTYAGSTLTTAVGASSTTLPVADLSKFNVNDRAIVGGVGNQSAAEMVFVTGKSSSTGAGSLTVTRGINSQNNRFPAVSHNATDYVRPVAYVFGNPSNMTMNVTQTCPSTNVNPSLGSQTWADFVGNFAAIKLSEPLNQNLDGVFLDNMVDFPLQIINNLSRADINNTNTASGVPDAYWSGGMQNLCSRLRSRLGGGKIVHSNTGASASLHGSVLNGGMIEGVDETGSNSFIGDVRGFYNSWMSLGLSPRIFVMNGSAHGSSLSAVQTNYKALRFLLTWTLANDGFFVYDEFWYSGAHSTEWWYDEFDNAGQGVGYLGQPLGASTQPMTGVYRRDFTSGISLSNTTAGVQSISLGGQFRKIRGTQAPSVNDGSLVTSVTLQPKDGIILLRV